MFFSGWGRGDGACRVRVTSCSDGGSVGGFCVCVGVCLWGFEGVVVSFYVLLCCIIFMWVADTRLGMARETETHDSGRTYRVLPIVAVRAGGDR